MFGLAWSLFSWMVLEVTVFKGPGDDPTETSGRQDECTRQFKEVWAGNRKS
jgi:hypothetical protein